MTIICLLLCELSLLCCRERLGQKKCSNYTFSSLLGISTTDLVLVIFDDFSLLIGVHVWSLIYIMWLSLSLTSTNAMALHESPVEQRQDEIPHFRWNFRVNFRPSNSTFLTSIYGSSRLDKKLPKMNKIALISVRDKSQN